MTSITPIEKVEIHVLVDNATDSLSTMMKLGDRVLFPNHSLRVNELFVFSGR